MTLRNKIIISAFKSNLDLATNLERHTALLSVLHYINQGQAIATTAQGRYKGTQELSAVVSTKNLSCKNVTDLAYVYDQKSFLYVGADGKADLIYTVDPYNPIRLGTLELTDEKTARLQDSYTKIDGKFYCTFRDVTN